MEVYRRLRPGDLVTPDTAQDLIFNMFFNFDRYDLSKVGRWKTWLRLPNLAPKNLDKEITKEDRILKIEDVVEVVKEIIRLNNDPMAKADQVDHVRRKGGQVLFDGLLVANVGIDMLKDG